MLSRLKSAARRPARAGSVFLSYIGIIAALAFTVNVGGDSQRAVKAEASRADAQVVMTGRAAIKSGCEFDNRRAEELRGILKRSLQNQRNLVKQGALDPKLAARNIRITKQGIAQISLRDCDKVASVLTSEPKEPK